MAFGPWLWPAPDRREDQSGDAETSVNSYSPSVQRRREDSVAEANMADLIGTLTL